MSAEEIESFEARCRRDAAELYASQARLTGELDVAQWLCCVQEPLQDFFEVANGALTTGSQISLRVLDRARQGVDVVVQAVKFVARHD